jgi:hypothetical protein
MDCAEVGQGELLRAFAEAFFYERAADRCLTSAIN